MEFMEDLRAMINILYEDNHILVVEKPINIPVQEDSSQDMDLLTQIKQYIKEKYHKPGNVYVGLIHRLDRPVGGVMVFAKTSKAASRLSEQLRMHKIGKKYHAIVLGKVNPKKGTLIHYLEKDEKKNKVYVSLKGKEAILDYEVLQTKENFSLVDIALKTGRPHQIRVQFATIGHPLYGDQKYSQFSKVGEQIALFSYYLTFNHPITGEKMEFRLENPNRYPWNLFKM